MDEIPSTQLSQLPEEILLKIMSLVPTQDLLLNVATVSKQFYELSKNTAAHIHVQVFGGVSFDFIQREKSA